MSKRKLSIPSGSVNILSNRGFLTDGKTELDRMGVPKSFKKDDYNFRTRNYFYRLFDHIGRQLAVINQGLNDSGPKRVWQVK